MIDAQQWMIGVLFDDMTRMVAGLVILIITIEIIFRVKGWLF